METFVLALGLGMVSTAMSNPDAQRTSHKLKAVQLCSWL